MADFAYVSHRPFPADRLAVVFGGSGFIGRHVIRALVKRGWRVRVAVRRPDLANFLQPIGVVGQINSVQANLRFPDSIEAALVGADAAINLVGVKKQRGAQRFDAVHVDGAAALARAVAARGLPLVHMSGIGANPASPSAYIASKAKGEAAIRAAAPSAIVLRPSIVFGPEDDFFNRFALLARYSPVLPVFGGGATRLQPVYVGDVAEAAARLLEIESAAGHAYELGGPEIMTLRQVVEFVCRVAERRRILVSVPFGLAAGLAGLTEFVDSISLGFFPKALAMSRDDIALLRTDNVVSPEAIAAGLTLAGLGIDAEGVEAVAPAYLYRFRRSGQFADGRFA